MSLPKLFPDLETPRLRLREIQIEDAADYLEVFGNAEHMHLFGIDPIPNLAAAEALIAATRGSHMRENPTTRWGIEAKITPGLIGNCGLFAWNKNWRKCSLGFALGEKSQGIGYMNEALNAVLTWAFTYRDLNRIDAQVHPDNTQSLQVLKRLKFIEEGRLRQLAYWGGEHHDMLQYSLLRTDWGI